MATKPPPIPRDSIPSKPSILRKVSDPPAKNTMTQGEWTRTAVWAGGIIFGIIGTVWGFATAFADLQDEAEVEKTVAPVAIVAADAAAVAAENKTAVHGLKVRLDGFEKSQDKLDGKLDAVLEVVMESAEYQREAIPRQARPRARKRAASRAARVRAEAEAEYGDPLGALETDR